MDITALELSRAQFGLTALYHFIFVPLTIGLAFVIAVMETLHLRTGNPVWREAARFWGKFFFLNWLCGIATGIPLRLQLANNWEAYSAYVHPVISETFFIEGVLAPFLFGAAFLFALTWKRLSARAHCIVSWFLAAFLCIQSISILAINAWMGTPVGVEFSAEKVKLVDLLAVYLSPITLDKFGHTMAAATVAGSVFVMSFSAWYLLRGKHREMAAKSFKAAAIIGLINAQAVMLMGHLSALNLAHHQPMKFAAMEAMWREHPVPAPLTAVGLPDMESRETHYAVQIPYLLTLLAAPGFDRTLPGIEELVAETEGKIRADLRSGDADLGPALLLRRYTEDPRAATDAQIVQAAWDSVPEVPVVFWALRFMVGIGIALVALFAVGTWLSRRGRVPDQRGFLWLAVCALPLPWLAIDAGWLVAELGRQPWTVTGVLPTLLSGGNVAAETFRTTLIGFGLAYAALAATNIFISLRYLRRGPEPFPAQAS